MDDMENTIDDMIHYYPSSSSSSSCNSSHKNTISEGLHEILIHCIKKKPGMFFFTKLYIFKS